MSTEQPNVINNITNNIEKKKRGRPSKTEEEKIQNKNEYMKTYMKEYSKDHKKFIQCEACNKSIQNTNQKNHFSSMEHNYNVLQKKLEDIEGVVKN